ncbi:N-acetylmuramoyl-L-alanine amidase-like domain-containing protein [Cyanobium gracile]|uniref:N-acetylmuramoyl-L-alanine amidase-like domain-containing protein n=1 Tax=Cyanobium gracile UHCC 0281 TaxID=3110309 RepID=A0ABU5SVV5_9CYAN|nr:N-acetylmuramoyl-L-alanine amidase-like domain-containing protein [Cyanobium gracile]MEA5442475.1 N-acetylmuramoyl-L-alanine amidase-like domain-containing protein [Cyanobium gracile UHCC 0281]
MALGDPPPGFVGESRALTVEAIDATAWAPINQSLVSLARLYLALPFQGLSRHGGPKQKLLALSNSRKVDTQDEGVERFTQHVRRLRYVDGEVDYCRRQHYFSRWAEAAERNGYVVNLTPFLPGASSRTVALNFMSNHIKSYKPMQLARNRQCITELEKDLVLNQPYIPLAALPGVLPSLRSGDIFGLVTKVPGLDVTHVGFLEKRDGVVDAIHAAEGAGVIRSENFAKYAGRVPDVIGVAIYRPRPNDGREGSGAKPGQ